MSKLKITITIIASCFTITACTSTYMTNKRVDINLTKVNFDDLKNWKKDDHVAALTAFLNSCNKIHTKPDSEIVSNQIATVFAKDFKDICKTATDIKVADSTQAKFFFETWFTPFLISNSNRDCNGIFTGYYIPTLNGSRTKSDRYRYPIYKKPLNLGSEPYHTRQEIELGALNNQDLELLYVDDKIELFFMHIQGSGIVMTEDGTMIRLSYSANNNQPYSSIGKYMIDNDIIYSDSNFKIYFIMKKWLKDNLDKADQILNQNSSYVFFKENYTNDVIGNASVPLKAERSIAIDNNILPYGYPFWVEIEDYKLEEYQKLLISQDTGGAIRGTIRGDIFFGSSKKSENRAGHMNNRGRYYILLPNDLVNRFINLK